jgi:hypothetical protein
MHTTINLHHPPIREVRLSGTSGTAIVVLGEPDEYSGVTMFFDDVDALGKWLANIEAQRINLIARQLISA